MDIQRLVTRYAYRIEERPEGGFIAHATDPTVPPIHAPTREDLQKKIQETVMAGLAADFPKLNLLAKSGHQFTFHIEHKPGGGFTFHSGDSKAAPIEAHSREEIESRVAEKLLPMIGKILMPELSRELQQENSDIKVVVNEKTVFRKGAEMTLPTSAPSSSGNPENVPITPEGGSLTWLRLLLVVLIILGLAFLYYHR